MSQAGKGLLICQAYRDVGRGHREASGESGDCTTVMTRPWSSCKRVRCLPKDEAGPNNANAPEHVQGRVSLAYKQLQTMGIPILRFTLAMQPFLDDTGSCSGKWNTFIWKVWSTETFMGYLTRQNTDHSLQENLCDVGRCYAWQV